MKRISIYFWSKKWIPGRALLYHLGQHLFPLFGENCLLLLGKVNNESFMDHIGRKMWQNFCWQIENKTVGKSWSSFGKSGGRGRRRGDQIKSLRIRVYLKAVADELKEEKKYPLDFYNHLTHPKQTFATLPQPFSSPKLFYVTNVTHFFTPPPYPFYQNWKFWWKHSFTLLW